MIVIMGCWLLPSAKAGGAGLLRINGGRSMPTAQSMVIARRRFILSRRGFLEENMQPEATETKVYFGCLSCGAIYGAVQIKAGNGVQSAHICELCSAEVVSDSPDFQIRDWTRVKPLQSFSA
jgi:hypothetical protein